MYPFNHQTAARLSCAGRRAPAGLAFLACLALFVSAFVSAPVSAVPTSVGCTSALALEAGEPWSWTTDDLRNSELVAVDVPAAGWLAVEVDAEGEGTGATWLQVLDPDCGIGADAATDGFVDRGLVKVREPGTVHLRLGKVHDLSPRSPSLRLTSHFFERTSGGEKDGAPGDNTEEEDGEIVPLLFPGDGCGEGRGWSATSTALEKDGAPGDNTEEEDGEIVPILADPSCSSSCAGHEPANDLLYCAGVLEAGVARMERLASRDGRDRDYFRFTLDSLGEVRVAAESDLVLRATILDLSGRVLVSEELRDDEPLRATLTPGLYFLRVEGVGEGDYRIELEGEPMVF